MSRTKAFIFDLDGVIVDTARFHFISWREIAARFNFDFTEVENEKLKGISRVQSLDLILEWASVNIDQKTKDTLLTEKNDIYLKYTESLDRSDLLPGIDNLIKELKKRDIKIAIGSASKNARFVLDKLNIIDEFDAIVDGTDVSKSKPDPEVFLKGALACGVAVEDCLVIEDSEAGLIAAKKAGMKTIASGLAPELRIADYQYASMEEISEDLLNRIIEEEVCNQNL